MSELSEIKFYFGAIKYANKRGFNRQDAHDFAGWAYLRFKTGRCKSKSSFARYIIDYWRYTGYDSRVRQSGKGLRYKRCELTSANEPKTPAFDTCTYIDYQKFLCGLSKCDSRLFKIMFHRGFDIHAISDELQLSKNRVYQIVRRLRSLMEEELLCK